MGTGPPTAERGHFSLRRECLRPRERCSRLERGPFALERNHGRRRGRSRGKRRPPIPQPTAKNTRRRKPKSGSRPRGGWLSAKSTAKPDHARDFESPGARNPSFLVSNHHVAHFRRLFSCSCHGNQIACASGEYFSLRLGCSRPSERCSRLERIPFAIERSHGRRRGRSRSKCWPPIPQPAAKKH